MTFDAERFAEIRTEQRLTLGDPLVLRAVTGSTNDDALAAAREGAPHGALFVADRQTAGRGRRGNRWFGAPGASLTFSLILRPRLALERAGGLALIAGLAVRAAVAGWCAAARQEHLVLVKWPNDVVVTGRKLSGILVESQVRSGELLSLAMGVGLNLGPLDLPAELVNVATSLLDLGISERAPERLVAAILEELEPRLAAFSAGGTETSAELARYDALAGVRVRVGEVTGVASGIDGSGCLLVRDDKGIRHAIVGGHVELSAPCGSPLDEA